ncbi:MAG: hypothetical protein ACYDAJ_07895 [Nitrosotalea sp.]
MREQISYQMDGCLNAKQTLLTEFSQIEAEDKVTPVFYDEIIYDDLAEKVLSKGWTFEQYSNYVATTRGNTYKGINKFLYEKTIVAIKTIVYYKKQRLRSRPELVESVAFLHQDMKISPNTIYNLLLMFGVILEVRKILAMSNEIFASKPIPEWLQHVIGNGGA